jgi:hypothetical protein
MLTCYATNVPFFILTGPAIQRRPLKWQRDLHHTCNSLLLALYNRLPYPLSCRESSERSRDENQSLRLAAPVSVAVRSSFGIRWLRQACPSKSLGYRPGRARIKPASSRGSKKHEETKKQRVGSRQGQDGRGEGAVTMSDL